MITDQKLHIQIFRFCLCLSLFKMPEEIIEIQELDPEIIPPLSERLGDPSYMGGSKIVIVGKPGCFSKGTLVRMYDGSRKAVEDVAVGDVVMGDDGTPRNVLDICRGEEDMYSVLPQEGFLSNPYTVNFKHKLVIWESPCRSGKPPLEITVQDYLKGGYEDWYICKTPLHYSEKPTEISPYEYGLSLRELGAEALVESAKVDNVYKIRKVDKPEIMDKLDNTYLYNSIEVRMQVLAGFMDSFRSLQKKDLILLNMEETFYIPLDIPMSPLIEWISELIQSLALVPKFFTADNKMSSLYAGTRGTSTSSTSSTSTTSPHYPFSLLVISGNCSLIPVRRWQMPFTHRVTKESLEMELRSLGFQDSDIDSNIEKYPLDNFCKFTVCKKNKDNYYGFTLDGNHRFLLASGDIVRNTGKTFLIRSLLYAKKHVYPIGLAFSGSEDTNHTFSKFIPSTFIYNKYDEEKIKDFINRQKLAAKHLQNPWAVMIIDDCADDPKIFNKPLQNFLYKNGRHYYFTYILSLQYAMDIRPQIRTLIDGIFILRETIGLNREKLYKNYASIIPTYKIFCAIMDQLTHDYHAIYIHNATTSNDWRKCVFYWKAKAPPEGWKLGCPEFWEFHNSRYNPDYVDPIMI